MRNERNLTKKLKKDFTSKKLILMLNEMTSKIKPRDRSHNEKYMEIIQYFQNLGEEELKKTGIILLSKYVQAVEISKILEEENNLEDVDWRKISKNKYKKRF